MTRSPPSAAVGAARIETEPMAEGSPDLETLRSGLRLMALWALSDADRAEEVAQEVLFRCLQALHDGRVRDPARISVFARSVARHVIADAQRERSTRSGPLPDHLSASGPDPLHLVISAEEQARVRSALDRLSPSDREVLRLVFFEGLLPAEIALQCNQPASRVRKRKERALARLREAMLASSAPPPSPPESPVDRQGGAPRRGRPGS